MEATLFDSVEQLEHGTPTDKVIRLKSVYKMGKTTVQPVSDGRGWYKGVPKLSEEDKRKLKYWAEPDSKFVIKDGTTFDLNKELDRVTWEWVKHAPCIVETEEECQFTPGAEFFIYIEGKEAQKSISRREKKFEAMKLILEDNSMNYPLRAKLLGVNMDGEPLVVIKDYLTEEAEKNPQKILDIYKSHDISVRLLLMKAKEKGIIKIDTGGIYRYGNNVLGVTENSAISWLQDPGNKHIVSALEQEVNPEYFVTDEKKEEKIDDPDGGSYPISKFKKNK